MRADDLFADFPLLPPMPPAPVGNMREPVPATVEAAEARFRCITLGCDMQGKFCASYWRAAEDGAASRPSCRGCPAGKARESLLRGVVPTDPSQRPAQPVSRCQACGMLRNMRHTPAACQRVSQATAAAASARLAKQRDAARRAVERAAARERERERAAEERRRKRAERERMTAAQKAERKARAAAEAAEARRVKESQRPPSRKPIAEMTDAEASERRLRNREIKRRERERRATERRAAGCAVGNCVRPASLSRVGAYCFECMRAARGILARGGQSPSVWSIRTLLSSPTFSAPPDRPATKFTEDSSGAPIDWIVAGIGDASDMEVARRTGTTRHAVRAARTALGIEPHGGRKSRIASSLTDADWAALGLGVRTDAQIAREIGVSPDQVGEHRRRMGIDRAPTPDAMTSGIDWSAVDLGGRTDIEIARDLGVHKSSVAYHRRMRGIDPHCARQTVQVDWDTVGLGTRSDVDIAKAIGVHHRTVLRERQKRGIAPHAHRGVRGIIDQIDWSAVDWAAEPDWQIAEAFGVSRQTAARARARCEAAPKSARMILRTHDWSTVDWSRADVDIAAEFGCRTSTIAGYRRRVGAAPLTRAQCAAARAADIRRKAAELAAAHDAAQSERARRKASSAPANALAEGAP